MSCHFHEVFRRKLQKVPHFVKKNEKSAILAKLATFRKNYHVFTFRWTLWQKFAKTASFRKKARKLIDLAKTMQLFEQTTMFWHFDEVFSKKLQKMPRFVKKHEKSSIWRKLATFPTNYHVLTLWWTCLRKVAESASFSEKTLKIIDWAKTCNFSSRLPCLCIFMNFSERSCKKCFISWKSTRNHRFRKHYATFQTNYHVFAFRWSFKEKVGKSGSFREKARKLMDLVKTCNFSKKLPCFCVSMNFMAKICKNCVIS